MWTQLSDIDMLNCHMTPAPGSPLFSPRARTVDKRAVGILLEYFLVHNTNTMSLVHRKSGTPQKGLLYSKKI